MGELEDATRDAIRALVHRLRADHGDTDPLGPDAEPFAAEFVAAMKLHGWRPVCVPPAVADWRYQPGGDSDRARRGAALAKELLANRQPFVPEQGQAPETETSTEGKGLS